MSATVLKVRDALSGKRELTDEDILDIAENFRRGVEVKDRRYRFTVYRDTFVGSQAVSFLIKFFNIQKRGEARIIGQKLMDAGVFSHVMDDHNFEDDYLFYKINATDVMEQLKKERNLIRKEGILEVKGYFFTSKMFFRVTGNILSQFDQSGAKLKGKFNLKNAEITEVNSNKQAFEVKMKKGGTLSLKAESELAKAQWITMLCKGKEGITEDEKLIQLWKTENDPCISCIAAFALEQQERDEEASSSAALAISNEQNKSSTNLNESEKKQEIEAPKAEAEPSAIELMDELFGLEIEDVAETSLKLRDIFKSHDVIVLALLRHFG